MNFSFWNPLSDKFLLPEPEHSQQRQMDAAQNSFGKSEDPRNWRNAVFGYGTGYADPIDPYDSNGILFDAVFSSKRQRINSYRNLALYPFVRKCLTMMADEACCENASGEVATFDIDKAYRSKFTETELMTLRDEFNYIINCVIGKDKMWYYYYTWLIDAELFLEICLNSEGNAVAGIKQLPPYCTMCIYDDGLLKGFIEDTKMLDPDNQQGEAKTFTMNQIAYSNYGFWGNNRNDVRGHLEAAVRPINQLRAIEDALTVYRITRAPEKRIFKIFTGKMPVNLVPEYMQELRAKYRKQLTIDPVTGMINCNNNVQAFVEDFWLAQDVDGQGSTIESFKGSTEFNGQLDDVKMFREQVADAMMIPSGRWQSAEGGGAQYTQGIEALTLEEASFQKLNKRLRRKFADIIYQIFIVHLQVRGYKSKFLDKNIYNIDLVPATDFERMRDLAMVEKRGGVVGAYSQFLPTLTNVKPGSEDMGPLFSRQFFLEDILGFTSEQRIRNDKLIEEEKAALLAAADAVKEEGGDEADEDSGDDLGF
jgi:hypothetical protein